MTKTINSKILIRRDTSANWSTNNPTLAAGEIGFDTTVGKHKIGNGSTTWNNLPYFALMSDVVYYALSKSGSTITLTGSDGSTSSVTDSNTTYTNVSSFTNDAEYQTRTQVNALIAAALAEYGDGDKDRFGGN